MSNTINIDNIYKKYKGNEKPSVDGLSFSVNDGAIFGLLGPNGAGKSTSLNIMCGLQKADSGDVTICGFSVKNQLCKIKHIIGVVPQDFALYPTLTAKENLTIYGGIYNIKNSILKERINELLNTFDLSQNANKRVEHFSGGMKRRLNLIVALLHRPKVLFLDEPTVGIDVQSRLVIIDNLKKINNEGTTMLYTSHHLAEAQALCSDILLIDNGKKICEGTPTELIKRNDVADIEELFILKTGKKVRD